MKQQKPKSVKKAQDELIAELARQRAILEAKYGFRIKRRPYDPQRHWTDDTSLFTK